MAVGEEKKHTEKRLAKRDRQLEKDREREGQRNEGTDDHDKEHEIGAALK